ncbi:BnaC02g26120D [Brassica napus]|uniref:BnaC02g26120D protein n=1 Tax=Brassica napus TaxID=3708 RepID=A0A078H7U6_BRANA|nr:BnaC02g26120D [Brassica napus]
MSFSLLLLQPKQSELQIQRHYSLLNSIYQRKHDLTLITSYPFSRRPIPHL